MPGTSLMERVEKMLGLEGAMPDSKLRVLGVVVTFVAFGLLTPIAIADGTLNSQSAVFGFGILASLVCGGVFYVLQKLYWETKVPRKGLLLAVAGVSYALLIWLFAGLYILISRTNEKAFYFSAADAHYQRLDVTEGVYFSVATIATVGYGDIVPVSPLARWLVIAEIVVGASYTIYVFSALVTLLLSQQLPRNEVPPNPPS
jgi:hypothetical protein